MIKVTTQSKAAAISFFLSIEASQYRCGPTLVTKLFKVKRKDSLLHFGY
jgi:hypothetical protein